MVETFFLIITLLYAIVATFYSLKSDHRTLEFFLIAVFVQNIICIIFYRYVPKTLIFVFGLIKELSLYMTLVFSFIKGKIVTITKERIVIVSVLLLLILKNLINSNAGSYAAIMSLRIAMIPVLCIAVGEGLGITDEQIRKLFIFITRYVVVLALFGIVERFLLGDMFWTLIGYEQYAVDFKGNETLFRGVTVNYYTWDIGGEPIRRMVSLTADPLATAYLLFFGCALLMTGCRYKNHGRRLLSANMKLNLKDMILMLFALATVLTFSKAIIVLFAVLVLSIAYSQKWQSRWMIVLGTIAFGVLILAYLYVITFTNQTQSSSAYHVTGLVKGLENASLLGEGLGTAGVNVVMYTGAKSNVGESFFGVLAVQLGTLGLLLYVIWMYYVLHALKRAAGAKEDRIIPLSILLLKGLFICMLFSESAVSISGTGVYFIMMGIALNKCKGLYLMTSINEQKC